jgi:hypothetical protein
MPFKAYGVQLQNRSQAQALQLNLLVIPIGIGYDYLSMLVDFSCEWPFFVFSCFSWDEDDFEDEI